MADRRLPGLLLSGGPQTIELAIAARAAGDLMRGWRVGDDRPVAPGPLRPLERSPRRDGFCESRTLLPALGRRGRFRSAPAGAALVAGRLYNCFRSGSAFTVLRSGFHTIAVLP